MQTETIGERIRHLRENSGRSQQALADKLYVSQETVSSWERDRTEPSADMFVKLANVFHTTLNYLIIGKEML